MTETPTFALRIDFLTGLYCAQAHDDRNWPEWPPHPARVFSALVAAWAQAGQDPSEQAALEWLESLPAPSIQASQATVRGIDPARGRAQKDRPTSLTTYVPVNDASVISVAGVAKQYGQLRDAQAKAQAVGTDAARAKAAKALATKEGAVRKWSAKAQEPKASGSLDVLPGSRPKQPRTFPVALPDDPVVHLIWADTTEIEHREVLDKLASRVARLGHSASLVSMSVVDEAPPATLVPSSEGFHIRVPGPGQLAALVRAHEVHQGTQTRHLPFRSQLYREVEEARELPRSTMSGEWLVLEAQAGARLLPTDAMAYCQAIRAALMSHASEPVPTILSGHEPDGSPALRPHVAILPLPFIGREYADGGIRGFALMLPPGASTADAAAVGGALQSWGLDTGGRLPLRLAGGREIELSLSVATTVPWSLTRYRWSRPSRAWTTVTPLAFDRAPGKLWSSEPTARDAAHSAAAEVVGLACERVGLPRPIAVEVTQHGGLVGVPDLRDFPAYESPGRRVRRISAHVKLTFAEPVRGPLVLGAGRFFGMGLFAPVREGSENDALDN